MQMPVPTDPRLVAAALRWWDDMGVDTLVEDAPQPWLGRVAKAVDPQMAAAEPRFAVPKADVIVPTPAAFEAPLAPLPQSLEALVDWLMQDAAVPEAGPADRRLRPFGTPGAAIAIVTDMPEQGDAEAGMLLSGDAGLLFDRMLAAIGLDRSSVYCLPLCPGRPPTGRLSPSALARLGEIARHHLTLVAPKRVWVLGQATSQALLGEDATTSSDEMGADVKQVAEGLPCIASLHPRLLLQAPQRKAAVWKDMQALIGGLA
jgi:DNA polymerase